MTTSPELTAVQKFGQPQWAFLFDVEKACVEGSGLLRAANVRVVNNGVWHSASNVILRDLTTLDDLVSAGLVQRERSHPRAVSMTKLGWVVAGELRRHRSMGGTFQTFAPSAASFQAMIAEQKSRAGQS